jgi:hypothetical protein
VNFTTKKVRSRRLLFFEVTLLLVVASLLHVRKKAIERFVSISAQMKSMNNCFDLPNLLKPTERAT